MLGRSPRISFSERAASCIPIGIHRLTCRLGRRGCRLGRPGSSATGLSFALITLKFSGHVRAGMGRGASRDVQRRRWRARWSEGQPRLVPVVLA